jgi:ribosomal protein L11 methyltransferase
LGSVPALDLLWRSSTDVDLLCELLQATLDDFEPLAIHDQVTADGWRVFFRSADQRQRAFDALRATFADRLADLHIVDVIDEGWARRSQANLTAVRVGRILVAPPWDATPLPSDLLIVIDPSTGFGTGHHETTRLCLRLMQEDGIVPDDIVIDVGTGSGVLAIAAAKLGATSVVAFDEDPEALRNARENVVRNQVSDRVTLRELDLGSAQAEMCRAGLVVANLTSGVLSNYAAQLIDLVASEGRLLISGFHPDELSELLDAFGRPTFTQSQEGDWAAAILRVSPQRSHTRN